MHGHGHHVGTLFSSGLCLGHGLVDIGLMVRISGFAKAIHTPVVVRRLRIQRYGSRNESDFAAARRRIDDQRLIRILFGFIGTGLRYAVLFKRVPQTCDAVGTLIPRMIRSMSAGIISHIFRGIGHFWRNIENRIGGIWTATLCDRCFEFTYGDVGSFDIFAHRLEQTGEIKCGAVGGRGVGAGILVPQSLMEQQITVDKHGDAIGIGTIRGIAMMLRRFGHLFLFNRFWLAHRCCRLRIGITLL